MQKLNKLSKPKHSPSFFLWYVVVAFGIIFLASSASAAPEDLYSAPGKRDPFLPLVKNTSRHAASGLINVESLEEITIEGIVFDPKNGSMVLVNGSLLKEGEEQGAVKVVKIEPAGVLFSVNGIEGFREQYQSDESKPRKTADEN